MFWLSRVGSIILAVLFCFALDKIVGMPSVDDFTRRLVVLSGLYVTLSVSLNLINGITGQFSMGHAAFYQVGAYTAGFLSVKYFSNAHLPGPLWMLLMMVAGAVIAALAGLIVGLPSLRLKGDYLAIVTLGFGEIIRIIVQNQKSIGGSYGMNVQPKFPALFGQTGTLGVWMVWLLAIVCIATCRNLIKNVHGLPFLAVREDEVASSAMGVNVTGVKVVAFLLGSAFAGAAGALLAHYEGFISPTMFTMELSFVVLTMVVLGGTGSITGSTIAALVLYYFPEKLRDMPAVPVSFLIGGAVGAVAMVVTMKWLSMNYHGKKLARVGLYFAALGGGVLATILLGRVLKMIPLIGNAAPIEANKLRMVIFALTLIFLMLLRPQGVFGHHEFSWRWLKQAVTDLWGFIQKLIRRKKTPSTPAVSA